MLSAERQLPCLPAVPCPHHYVQIRGLRGSPSKPSGRGHGAVWGLGSRGCAGPITPWHHALWEHWGSNWLSWSCCSPTLSALQRLRKLAWQGKLSGASFPQAALSLLPLTGGRHGNTEGLGRGSSEPKAPGTEPRSPRQAHWQGHNTEGKKPQSLATESRLDKPHWSQGV